MRQIIYTAKGSNRNWKWLSMISVCLFMLRDAMRTVQLAYKIPVYGTSHTVPDMAREIQVLVDSLASEKVQEHVANRSSNASLTPVRDLLEEGSKYSDTRDSFSNYKKNYSRAVNRGVQQEDGENPHESYLPSPEDLSADTEEDYERATEMVERAESLASVIASDIEL
jgi:hypothetical protein